MLKIFLYVVTVNITTIEESSWDILVYRTFRVYHSMRYFHIIIYVTGDIREYWQELDYIHQDGPKNVHFSVYISLQPYTSISANAD